MDFRFVSLKKYLKFLKFSFRFKYFKFRYLNELLVENSSIKPQDFFDVISYVGRNPTGRHIAWFFIRERWSDIVVRLNNNF